MHAIRVASALILRRGVDDPRLFLARRCVRMRFFGNVFAFPGGTVDRVDRELASKLPSKDREAYALRSALVREMIEELALDLRPDAPANGRVSDEIRRAILDSPQLWRDHCRVAELDAIGDSVLRLVTPDFYPRRFDTRLFLHTLGDRAEPQLLPEELEESDWDLAQNWLDRWHRGELMLAPPTILTLEAMASCTWEDAPAALRELQLDVEGVVPQRIQVEPAVQLVALRTPTLPPAQHTNTYFVGLDPAYVVDPGTPHADELHRLELAMDRARERGLRFEAILFTHSHVDHVGGAAEISKRQALPIYAHAITASRLSGKLDVDRHLEDDTCLSMGELGPLRCLHTPGHAPGHLCFHAERFGSLIAGDMLSTISSVLIHPDDGDMTQYVASLARLASLPLQVVHPAHGPSDTRGVVAIREQIEHRQRREADVLDAIRHGQSEIGEITATVYGDVPRPMLGYAQYSVRSILARLDQLGFVRYAEGRATAI